MSIISYENYQDIHAALLPAWDGHGVGSGYCPNDITDRSQAVWTTTNVPDPSIFSEYTPELESEWRFPPSSSGLGIRRPRDPDGKFSLNVTAYRRGKEVTHCNLVSVPRLGDYLTRWVNRQVWHPTGAPLWQCQEWCEGQHALQTDHSHWSEVGDYDYWHLGKGIPLVYLSNIDTASIANAVIETRNQACLDNISDWDGLTDALQLPGLLEEFGGTSKSVSGVFKKMVSSHAASDLKLASRIAPKNLLSNASRALRAVGKSWLAYRYTLGTSIMSYNDIKKVIESSTDKRSRKTRWINSEPLIPSSLPPNRIEVQVNGSVAVRSTVISRYSSTSQAIMQAITVNPLVTAWELIPMSFVADWFLNIGDFIAAHFSSNRAVQTVACTAIKTNSTTTFTLRHEGASLTPPSVLVGWSTRGQCETGQSQPVPPTITVGDTQGLLSIVVRNAYERFGFSCADANQLRFMPNINWLRTVDGVALTLNVLRSLRRSHL